jgi:hypothetical protein
MNDFRLNELRGLKIIESVYLTEPGDPIEVRRSWKERLFSRPWHPLKKTRTFIPQVPMRGAYRLGNDSVVMHPAMAAKLRHALQSVHN